MKSARKFFHKISYLQYPLMLVGLYWMARPLINNLNNLWADYNMALIFYGLAISLSTLQDTTKSQNKLSLKIWQSPRYARIFLTYIALLALVMLGLGIFGVMATQYSALNEISFGIISLGIGFVGVLKSGIEMAEHHQRAMGN